MDEPVDELPMPEGFSGQVRLFPLPNLVLFPHVVQPLHIFEPRYQRMMEAVLSDDMLIGMALLQPGWESQYDGRPPIHPVVCVGRIIAHSQLDDGCYNLLLQGVRRASVVREHPPEESYRVAEIAVLEDLYPAGGTSRRANLRSELMECFRGLLADSTLGNDQYEQMHDQQLSLGAMVDIVAYSLDLGLPSKQELLAEWNVDLRAVMLLNQLRRLARGEPPEGSDTEFPPPFSHN